MPLVSVKDLLSEAAKGGYAVPSFCCVNLETIAAVVETARDERAGVVVQFHPDFYRYAEASLLARVATDCAVRSPLPVAISLDHGETLEEILLGIRSGLTGVMIDASSLPLAENIRLVRQVVELCHPLGISVEAAIGNMGHGTRQTALDIADPAEAAELVAATGLDALAPAVGNVHGTAHGEEKAASQLDLKRIAAISRATSIPLVLHGGSSITADDLREAIDRGIRKVVFYSDMVKAFNTALKATLNEKAVGTTLIEILFPAVLAFKEEARAKIRALGAAGRY